MAGYDIQIVDIGPSDDAHGITVQTAQSCKKKTSLARFRIYGEKKKSLMSGKGDASTV